MSGVLKGDRLRNFNNNVCNKNMNFQPKKLHVPKAD